MQLEDYEMIYEIGIDITELVIKERESNNLKVEVLIAHPECKIVFYGQIKFCIHLKF